MITLFACICCTIMTYYYTVIKPVPVLNDAINIGYNVVSHKINYKNMKLFLLKCKIVYKIGKVLVFNHIHQKLYKTVKQVSKTVYTVTFSIRSQTYIFPVSVIREPSPVLQVINDKSEDITDEILQYMGPAYNWFGHEYSPAFFNYEEMTFELANSQSVTFYKNEILKLDKNI